MARQVMTVTEVTEDDAERRKKMEKNTPLWRRLTGEAGRRR